MFTNPKALDLTKRIASGERVKVCLAIEDYGFVYAVISPLYIQ